MKLQSAIAGVLFGAFALSAQAYDINDWPTHYNLTSDTEIAITGNYAWEKDMFSGISNLSAAQQATMNDPLATRREEFGVTLKKKGVYDAMYYYDFWNKTYLDVFFRLQSKPFFGADYGAFRIGYTKTWVGFEGVTSSRANSFLEIALPEQAFFEGRRTGIDWEFERPQYRFDVGYYTGQDLQGDNDGTTLAGRFAWTPFKAAGNVLHLGVSASDESPDNFTVNGKVQTVYPSARVRARPDAFLTATRFVDSGSLTFVDHINRFGLEGLWINGPWSVQAEHVEETVHRNNGLQTFSGSGNYIFGSWFLTGESRPYSGGNVGNVKPKGPYGAVELLARFDSIDLNDGAIHGGKQHNITLGANWYLYSHFRIQANYVMAHESGNPAYNHGLAINPKILLLRGQVYF